MSRFNKLMIGIWCALAIMSFIASFFAPTFIKIIGLTFGGLNMLVILTFIIAYIQSQIYNTDLEDVQL